MQNSHRFQNPDLFPFVNPVLAAAYLRARDAAGGAEPSARDLFAALGTMGATGGPPESGAPAPNAGAGPDTKPDVTTPSLDLDKLLRTLRVPLDLLLTVADLRAEDAIIEDGNAVDDGPAIRRVRAAIDWLAPSAAEATAPGATAPDPTAPEATAPDPTAPDKAPYVRASDLLIVIERLFGTIDLSRVPSLVVRLARALSRGVAEAIQVYPAMMSLFARMVPPAESHAPGETCFGGASPVHPPLASVYVAPFSAPSFEPHPFAAPQPFGPSFRPFVPCSHPPVDLQAQLLRALFSR